MYIKNTCILKQKLMLNNSGMPMKAWVKNFTVAKRHVSQCKSKCTYMYMYYTKYVMYMYVHTPTCVNISAWLNRVYFVINTQFSCTIKFYRPLEIIFIFILRSKYKPWTFFYWGVRSFFSREQGTFYRKFFTKFSFLKDQNQGQFR